MSRQQLEHPPGAGAQVDQRIDHPALQRLDDMAASTASSGTCSVLQQIPAVRPPWRNTAAACSAWLSRTVAQPAGVRYHAERSASPVSTAGRNQPARQIAAGPFAGLSQPVIGPRALGIAAAPAPHRPAASGAATPAAGSGLRISVRSLTDCSPSASNARRRNRVALTRRASAPPPSPPTQFTSASARYKDIFICVVQALVYKNLRGPVARQRKTGLALACFTAVLFKLDRPSDQARGRRSPVSAIRRLPRRGLR
jgi:hypothetical protein